MAAPDVSGAIGTGAGRGAAGKARAVVFAYHDVGVRCLKVLLDAGVDVALVVTHEDSPTENIWFASVRDTARDAGIETIAPADPNAADVVARIAALKPDFLFSFYYRFMLRDALLALPARGALNMHGSLLPRYRGRVPINWAVLRGERSTGASLHYMVAKPDAGDLVAQTEVPILADDTAGEVFGKVVVAAETTLWRVLPALIRGDAPRTPLDLAAGSYFGGRSAKDGQIDWRAGAAAIHNLVRAVAPPYPGAFFELDGHRFVVGQTRVLRAGETAATADASAAVAGASADPLLAVDGERIVAHLPDASLWLRRLSCDGSPCDAARLGSLLSLPMRLPLQPPAGASD